MAKDEFDDIRDALERILNSEAFQTSDLSSITFSSISTALQQQQDYVFSPAVIRKYKKEITNYIVEHCTKDDANDLNVDGKNEGVKKGKLSATESKIILDEIQAYMEEKELSLEDICPELRDEKVQKSNKELWDRIQQLLPTRKRGTIYDHAMRKLTDFELQKGPWSTEEKESLKALVTVHGHDWRTISRLINRSTFDCRDAYKRFSERKTSGKFTNEEDASLIAAIRKVCRISDSVPLSEMPAGNISWNNVAKELNNDRRPLDYQRRWGTLLLAKKSTEVNPEPQNSQQNLTLDMDIALLKYLEQSGATDETEVIWSEVDRLLHLPMNKSGFRWKLMCRKMDFPIGTDFTTRLESLLSAHGLDGDAQSEAEPPRTITQIEGSELSPEEEAPSEQPQQSQPEPQERQEVQDIAKTKTKKNKKRPRVTEAEDEQLTREVIADAGPVDNQTADKEEEGEGEGEEGVEERARREKKERKRARKEAKRAKREHEAKGPEGEENDKQEGERDKKRKKKKKKRKHKTPSSSEPEPGPGPEEEGR